MPQIKGKLGHISVLLFVILGMMVWGCAAECFGENCKIQLKGTFVAGEKYGMAQIVQAIDKEIRRVYWYYVQDAMQIFQANFDVPGQDTLHFFIYRNRVGTFLAIIAKKKDTLEVSVNTFARLGNGFTQDVPTKTQPMAIEPYIIFLKLSPYELILEQQGGNKTLKQVNSTAGAKKSSIEENTNKIDEYIRKNYWYYLDKAFLASASPLITNQKTYLVLTYINITGTYMVTAELDEKTGNVKVNTFLRLGAGSSTNQAKAIVVQPKMLGLG